MLYHILRRRGYTHVIPHFTTGGLYHVIPHFKTGGLYHVIPHVKTGGLYHVIPHFKTRPLGNGSDGLKFMKYIETPFGCGMNMHFAVLSVIQFC